MGCSEYEMISMWNVWDVACWGCGRLERMDVGDEGFWGCGKLGM